MTAVLPPQVAPGAAPVAAEEVPAFDLGSMIMHHLVDAHELELPWGGGGRVVLVVVEHHACECTPAKSVDKLR